jgi:hypothetical protein
VVVSHERLVVVVRIKIPGSVDGGKTTHHLAHPTAPSLVAAPRGGPLLVAGLKLAPSFLALQTAGSLIVPRIACSLIVPRIACSMIVPRIACSMIFPRIACSTTPPRTGFLQSYLVPEFLPTNVRGAADSPLCVSAA